MVAPVMNLGHTGFLTDTHCLLNPWCKILPVNEYAQFAIPAVSSGIGFILFYTVSKPLRGFECYMHKKLYQSVEMIAW